MEQKKLVPVLHSIALRHILDYLDLKSRAQFAATCSDFRELALKNPKGNVKMKYMSEPKKESWAKFGSDECKYHFQASMLQHVRNVVELEISMSRAKNLANFIYFLRSLAEFNIPVGAIINRDIISIPVDGDNERVPRFGRMRALGRSSHQGMANFLRELSRLLPDIDSLTWPFTFHEDVEGLQNFHCLTKLQMTESDFTTKAAWEYLAASAPALKSLKCEYFEQTPSRGLVLFPELVQLEITEGYPNKSLDSIFEFLTVFLMNKSEPTRRFTLKIEIKTLERLLGFLRDFQPLFKDESIVYVLDLDFYAILRAPFAESSTEYVNQIDVPANLKNRIVGLDVFEWTVIENVHGLPLDSLTKVMACFIGQNLTTLNLGLGNTRIGPEGAEKHRFYEPLLQIGALAPKLRNILIYCKPTQIDSLKASILAILRSWLHRSEATMIITVIVPGTSVLQSIHLDPVVTEFLLDQEDFTDQGWRIAVSSSVESAAAQASENSKFNQTLRIWNRTTGQQLLMRNHRPLVDTYLIIENEEAK